MLWESQAGSSTLVRDNHDGSQTERTYQNISDRKLAQQTQHSDFKPSLLVQERTVSKD